jgi:glucokinase
MRAGLDIGGTKTEAVALDESGGVVAQLRLPTGHGAEAVIASAVTAVEALAERAGVAARDLSSLGVGIPGAVDAATGVVSHAINLGVGRLELGTVLAERIGVPVHVENDVNAAAFGAYRLLGDARGSMAYLNLGTGLAAGIVVNGTLWRGARGAAGEIGHISVDPQGPLDLDGQPGGLEVVASGSGIARQWGEAGTPVSTVLDGAEAGDGRAVEIRRRLVEGVATAVRVLVLTVDVETVVIGGGLARLGSRFMPDVRRVIDRWAAVAPFIASLDLGGRMRLLEGDEPVAALGAAHLGGE